MLLSHIKVESFSSRRPFSFPLLPAEFSNGQFNKSWNNNPLGERVFLQGLSDVTYYSKALDKYNDGKILNKIC